MNVCKNDRNRTQWVCVIVIAHTARSRRSRQQLLITTHESPALPRPAAAFLVDLILLKAHKNGLARPEMRPDFRSRKNGFRLENFAVVGGSQKCFSRVGTSGILSKAQVKLRSRMHIATRSKVGSRDDPTQCAAVFHDRSLDLLQSTSIPLVSAP